MVKKKKRKNVKKQFGELLEKKILKRRKRGWEIIEPQTVNRFTFQL